MFQINKKKVEVPKVEKLPEIYNYGCESLSTLINKIIDNFCGDPASYKLSDGTSSIYTTYEKTSGNSTISFVVTGSKCFIRLENSTPPEKVKWLAVQSQDPNFKRIYDVARFIKKITDYKKRNIMESQLIHDFPFLKGE